jgi:hypothetical protein
MPTRYLKPGVRDSEAIDVLSPMAELFFYRLLVTVDDFGRYDARPSMLKAQCFPIKESVTSKDCEDLLIELVNSGLVTVYQHEKTRVVQVLKWDNKPRAGASKFPECGPECTPIYASADTCIQMCAERENPRTVLPLTVTVTGTETVTETETETRARCAPIDDKHGTDAPVVCTPDMMAGIPSDMARKFLQHRKSLKAKGAFTLDAWQRHVEQSAKAGITPAAAMQYAISSGWQAFTAAYYLRAEGISTNGPPKTFGQLRKEQTDAEIAEFLADAPMPGGVIEGEFTSVGVVHA